MSALAKIRDMEEQVEKTKCNEKDIHAYIHGKQNGQMGNAALLGMVLHQCGEHAKRTFGKYGIKKSHAGILFLVNSNPNMTQKDLAERLKITPPSVTAAIKEMERKGFLTRETDAKDMRQNKMALTQKGIAYIDSVKEAARELDRIMFAGIDEKEQEKFRCTLWKIHENMDRQTRADKADDK